MILVTQKRGAALRILLFCIKVYWVATRHYQLFYTSHFLSGLVYVFMSKIREQPLRAENQSPGAPVGAPSLQRTQFDQNT